MSAAQEKTREPLPLNRKLALEIEAANLLREQIKTIAGDDPDFIRDAIEGETSVREIIASMVAEDAADDAIVTGIKALITDLNGRKDRIEKRIEVRRAMIALGLEAAEIPKLETPAGTVSERPIAPAAIINDEASIPSAFWKPQPPKLDKKALSDALRSGDTIPGATLSNGGKTVAIRRK